MHVSTAYSFCIRCQIEEKIYRLEDDYQDIIDLVENADDYEIKQKELQLVIRNYLNSAHVSFFSIVHLSLSLYIRHK